MYETSGILNGEMVKELKKCHMSHKRKVVHLIFSFVYVLIGVSYIRKGSSGSDKTFMLYGYACMFLAFVALWLIYLSSIKFQMTNIDAMKEISDKGEFEFKVFFNENGANINNLTTSTAIEIKYEFFVRLEETPNMYVLFTKSGQYAIIFKDCLDDEEINTFEEFIKEKCKNIK